MINELAAEIYAQNKAKGFWDTERNVGELLMLIVSELAEALEAHRKEKVSDSGNMLLMLASGYTWEEAADLKRAFEKEIKDTFEDEIADAAIRIFDLAGGLGIDLDFHIQQKLAYNKTRPFKHGKKY
jgi:NTP pyrophosphatase (non-canonical NTP hydrolase)